ncbi:MAG TPA: BON domain-containing protein [Polyangiaceae bacterium]|nr:BON domain-containing protein [Polyangiaceae bacterium]
MKSLRFKLPYLSLALLLAQTGCQRKAADQVKPVLSSTATKASSDGLTDTAINAAVTKALEHDPGVDASKLHVKTTDGIVELTGIAPHLLTKQRAARVAEAVRGVRAVSDRTSLDVEKRPDASIADDLKNALLTNAAADSYEISEKVSAGKVTLTGSVQSFQERDIAGRLAEGIRGVREVDNQIKVKTGVARSDSEVRADVVSRLRWDTLVNDGRIDVAVHSGRVTLQGTVASASEKRRASVDAWVLGAADVSDSGLKVDASGAQQDTLKHQLFATAPADIERAIRAAIAYDPRVSRADLQVKVTDGRARLEGSVASVAAKLAAEDLARHTVGVTAVDNALEVKPVKARTDAQIEQAVKSALLWDPYTNTQAIQVSVVAGKVSLSGKAHSHFERAQATDLAAAIEGVKDVDNVIVVDHPEVAYVFDPYLSPYGPFWVSWYAVPILPASPDAQIASAIHDELVWDPFVDANHVQVDVKRGRATLRGRVASQRARTAATEEAYEGGAVAVDNRLTLSSGG